MSALNFPNNPSVNDIYTANGTKWQWDGISWSRVVSAGNQGFQGEEGAQGAQGHQGAQGVTGAQGTEGAQGAQGHQGAQGAQGHQGAVGAQGDQGAQGAQGHQGAQGAVGAQGAQGAQGAAGTNGAQGSTNNLEISETAPSSPSPGDLWWESDTGILAVYYDDGSGSPSAQWVEIGSSQGAQGAQGATGAQGAQGATGGGGSAGAQGAQGAQGATGAQGAQGASGTTVVRMWVDFNGAGVVAIRNDFNVNTITDNTTGDYTINFSSALPSSTYAMQVTGTAAIGSYATIGQLYGTLTGVAQLKTTSQCRILTTSGQQSSVDNAEICCSAFN